MPGTDLPDDIVMPDTLMFRDASSRDVFLAIGKFANISIAFDPTFRDQPITIDLRKAKLADALTRSPAPRATSGRTNDQRTVTIVPDTPAKRREYEEEIVRTFYLSNADLKETIDILRIVVDARRHRADDRDQRDHHQGHGRSGLPPPARIISAIDKARPEVVIDVELLEVDRTRMKEYGLQIASPGKSPASTARSTSIATSSRCATCAT